MGKNRSSLGPMSGDVKERTLTLPFRREMKVSQARNSPRPQNEWVVLTTKRAESIAPCPEGDNRTVRFAISNGALLDFQGLI